MTIFTQAITGNERAADTASPYAAFNSQNIDLMRANWLQTEEASMSNSVGGVKRVWPVVFRADLFATILFHELPLQTLLPYHEWRSQEIPHRQLPAR
jgi:hypothetical protein